jgi:hypothetical protein
MRYLALLALWAIPAGAAAPSSSLRLNALTEADVGADALKNSACYAHDGPAVLLVATKRNAIVNAEGDLLLLDRLDDDGSPSRGARYGSNSFKVVVSPAPGPVDNVASDGRTHQSAHISVRRRGSTSSITARWSCSGSRGA